MDIARRQTVRDATRDIGFQIKRGRALRRMSQEALAAALGVTFQQVQKYENGANRVSVASLLTIAEELQLPIDYFLPPRAHMPAVSPAELAAIRTELAASFEAIDAAITMIEGVRSRLLAAAERVARADPSPA